MAGKNEIRYRLGLDGDEDVKKKLDGVAEHGKNAFKGVNETIEKSGSSAGEGFQKSFDKIFEKVRDKFRESGGESDRGGSVAHKVREAIHTVHPIVEEADIGGLGRIGAFALAARVGIQSLAVALGGTLLVALEKLADEANSRIARLSSFTGSAHAGKEAEESLGKVADRIKLPASALASP